VKKFFALIISVLLILSGCTKPTVSRDEKVQSNNISQEPMVDSKGQLGAKDKDYNTNTLQIVQGFVGNEIEGSMVAMSADGSSLILASTLPEQSLKKVDVATNQGIEFYRAKPEWDILKVNVDTSGTKVFIYEGKREKREPGYPFISYAEFDSSIFDFTTGKTFSLSGVNYGWWDKSSNVFYALTGAVSVNIPLPQVKLVEYESFNSSPREITVFSNANIQVQSSSKKSVYLVDNKGEGRVTLYRVNTSSGQVENLGKLGRFPDLRECAVFSSEGNYYFSFNEQTGKTSITGVKNKDTKVVSNSFITKSIQWLPEEKQALFLVGDPKTKGNGPYSLYLYSRVNNTTKKVYPFKEQVLNMFLSPDSKKLYYVFPREDKMLTGVLSLEGII
jgi:hypothetical protein